MSKVIAIEGLDKAGKSTMKVELIKKLVDSGVKVDNYFEPWYDERTPKPLRDMVVDPAFSKQAQMYCAIATRLDLFIKHVIPSLDKGRLVVNDRSLITSAVYQSDELFDPIAVINANIDACKRFRRSFIPDVVVFLEIPHQEYLVRLQNEKNPEQIENFLADKSNYERFQLKYLDVLNYLERFHKVKVIRTNSAEKAYEKIKQHLEV